MKINKIYFKYLKEIFSNKNYFILYFILSLFFILIFDYFSNYEIIEVNLGLKYLYLIIFSQYLISFLLSLFFVISVYKFNYFKKFSIKEQSSSFIGGFVGFFITGCPSCSITLASYLGLGGLIGFLPYYGLELKFLSILILLYSNKLILYNLKTCNINKK
jgi:hypothetical protein